ncbi:ribonuclease H-like domain-containing protein [Tanacetum coccineum]
MNEVLFSKEVAVLKREVGVKEYELGVLRSELEKVMKEKDGIDFKITKFEKSTKYLGLDEFKETEVNCHAPRENVPMPTKNCEKELDNSDVNTDDSLEHHQVSDSNSSTIESPLKVDKETIIDWKEKFFYPAGKVDTVEPKHSENQLGGQLGDEFVMQNKSCFECGSFEQMKLNCPYQQKEREVSRNNYNRVDFDYYAKSNAHRHMIPRAVLLRNGLKPLNTARPYYTAQPKPTVNCARPKSCFSNQAHSTIQRPFIRQTTLTNRSYHQRFNTARPRPINTGRHRVFNTDGYRVVNTARPFINTARENRFNVGNPQMYDKGFVDSGCSRHMTSNLAYLSNFIEFDGGNVTFGGEAYGGRISGKGTLKTNNLNFDDVYFINELNFNIFSVSQIYDKKNYVLFTDSKCLVLSPDFKLPDENHILLRIPREDNMYSFNMHNIVPKENLTCLVAKDTTDESMLWHRRLGHINFKDINKLVKENLMRGLPLKQFVNDQTMLLVLKGSNT